MADTTYRQTSLLRRQLVSLGYEDNAALNSFERDEVAHETETMASFSLPPLVLIEPQRISLGSIWNWLCELLNGLRTPQAPVSVMSHKWVTWSMVAACTGFLVAYQAFWTEPSPGDKLGATLRIKGPTKVWVHYERAGKVATFTGHTRLINGDRVRVEVLAGGRVNGTLAVVSKDGRLLGVDFDEGSLALQAGQRATFPGSIQLVGHDEGERLMVTVCQRGDRVTKSQEDLLKGVYPGVGQAVQLVHLPKQCEVEEIKLR